MTYNPFTRLIRPSTRAFWREGRRTRNYGLREFLHGYIYARWPYLYIGLGTGEHPLARRLSRLPRLLGGLLEKKRHGKESEFGENFAHGYHGKAIPLDAARRLSRIDREVELRDLENVVPYATARDIVLSHPDHIVALDCPCRSSRAQPCLPLGVCLIVGEPFASFIQEHHPNRARRITSGEAAEILEAEHARGHVHHAFFKDAMLQRFYAICNCCSCCCGAMQAQRNGVPMLASSGYLARVDEDSCSGCATCEENCQFEAVRIVDGMAVVDDENCHGCGVCEGLCPSGAIRLEPAHGRGEPLEIEKLLERAGQKAN